MPSSPAGWEKASIIVTVLEGIVLFLGEDEQPNWTLRVAVCFAEEGLLVNSNGGKEGQKANVQDCNGSTHVGKVSVIKAVRNKKVQGLRAFFRVLVHKGAREIVEDISTVHKENGKGLAI